MTLVWPEKSIAVEDRIESLAYPSAIIQEKFRRTMLKRAHSCPDVTGDHSCFSLDWAFTPCGRSWRDSGMVIWGSGAILDLLSRRRLTPAKPTFRINRAIRLRLTRIPASARSI